MGGKIVSNFPVLFHAMMMPNVVPIKNAIKNMYSYKSNKFSKSKVIRLLKSIKKTDIVIKKK